MGVRTPTPTPTFLRRITSIWIPTEDLRNFLFTTTSNVVTEVLRVNPIPIFFVLYPRQKPLSTMKLSNAIALLLVAVDVQAFVPSSVRPQQALTAGSLSQVSKVAFSPVAPNSFAMPRTSTSLSMANEDFSQATYTEAAWAEISALTKAADYYQATSVEAVHLLDVMLNPNKHSAGEDAEAAKKAAEKVLNQAGVDVKALRQGLETYLSKQAKSDSSSQKTMGRSLQKTLETSRQVKGVLGVSESFCDWKPFSRTVSRDER